MYLSLNGQILQPENACIPYASEGLQYGYGLFETIKIYKGEMLFIKEHLERFQKGCQVLNIPIHYDINLIRKYCNQLISVNNIDFGALKILYTKNKNIYHLCITTRQSPYIKEKYIKGFALCFAASRKNPYASLTYIKSNNYLENILEKQKSAEKNCEEAIFLNTNHQISEGTYTNIFFVKDDTIYTPSVNCGLLPGIMRSKVMDLIQRLRLPLKVGAYDPASLLAADEIFVTNSLMDIMPVSQLEDIRFDLSNNPITQRLRSEFSKYYDSLK
ncbi:aminotransferase class IV [Clostridiaceae bacterium 35-E11]